MARGRHKEEHHENVERWLLTYADMITLLMAFFIMLYSMSQLDLKKFSAMRGSVQAELGTDKGRYKPKKSAAAAAAGILPADLGGLSLVELASRISQQISPQMRQQGLNVRMQGQEVTVQIPATKLYFAPGSAELTKEMLVVLQRLGKVLRGQPYEIIIKGHTCDLPVRNERYTSNWELSSDRARNVALYFIRHGVVPAERCSYMGLADTEPLVPNLDEAHRAKNRRVEIILRPASAALWGGAEALSPEAATPSIAPAPVEVGPHLAPVSPNHATTPLTRESP